MLHAAASLRATHRPAPVPLPWPSRPLVRKLPIVVSSAQRRSFGPPPGAERGKVMVEVRNFKRRIPKSSAAPRPPPECPIGTLRRAPAAPQVVSSRVRSATLTLLGWTARSVRDLSRRWSRTVLASQPHGAGLSKLGGFPLSPVWRQLQLTKCERGPGLGRRLSGAGSEAPVGLRVESYES